MEYINLTIFEMHKALVAKEVTPLQLTEAAIKLLKKDKNNVLEADNFANALLEAEKLTEPEEGNVFWGIPILIKDNISTKGIETTASSQVLEGYIPLFDATVVSKLKEAKAIILGKTTMDELGMGGSGLTGKKGTIYNPWDESKKRIIGGSSGGSAAAVAAGIVPFSLASDTGDSIRKPAGHAGLVGFKPTWGRISRYGLFTFASSLDHVGYFTRSTLDAALALNLLAGHDEKDLSSAKRPLEDYTARINNGLSGIKIAVINEVFELADKKYQEFMLQNLGELEKAGAIINRINIDKKLLEALFPTYYIISCAEASSNNARLDGIKYGKQSEGATYEEIMIKSRSESFSDQIKERMVFGAYALNKNNREHYYDSALKVRRLIVDAYSKILEEYDVIYVPATKDVAPTISDASNRSTPSSDEMIISNHLGAANLGGFPSITLPLGFKYNLPLGINLTVKPFEEAKLFQIAQGVENITGQFNLFANWRKKQ